MNIIEENYTKIKRFIEYELLKSISLNKIFNNKELDDIYLIMTAYIKHVNNKGISNKELKQYIDKFINFSKSIGLNDKEIINIIKKYPTILEHTTLIEEKYILMCIVENENNTLRKIKLINRPKDYLIELDILYARYALATNLDYVLTWNDLVKTTEKEFASIFTKFESFKPYKIFNNQEECSNENLKKMYPIDNSFIDELKELEINKCLKEKRK